MNRGKDPQVSLCERKFILEAIKESKRVDFREIYDYREINISLGKEPGHVEVTLGKTRVLARVTCQVIQPRPQRPTEGVLFFNVELSPMASPSFEAGKQSSMSVEVNRILERCQKESRAVDTESLCIIAGQKVWEVRVDLHVLDHCGNVIDCTAIAAITALKHFRRPDVTVVGEEATIHPLSERDPVPLSVHHIPVCFTFAFFWDGEYMLVDPSLAEEQVMEGKLVVGMNVHGEVCVLQMMGGVAILPEQVMRCTKIAAVKCVEITEMIKNAISGKSGVQKESFESILQSKRNEEGIDRDVYDSHLLVGDEGEREPMEEEEPSRREEVNYLGPGTAELVGLGGDNTWEVLDSIEDCSDGDAEATELNSKFQGKAEAMEDATATKKSFTGEPKHSDSEEEETIQLKNSDLAGATSDTKLTEQDLSSMSGAPKSLGGSGEDDGGNGSKKKKTRKGKKGRGGGSGGAAVQVAVDVGGNGEIAGGNKNNKKKQKKKS